MRRFLDANDPTVRKKEEKGEKKNNGGRKSEKRISPRKIGEKKIRRIERVVDVGRCPSLYHLHGHL